jgi:hypothetical protein
MRVREEAGILHAVILTVSAINVNFRSAVPKKELMKRSVTFELPIKSPFFTVA